MNLIDIIDLIGTVAFAISGGLAALRKKLDPFGVIIIAFATAAGGGSIRDVLIGAQPVTWMLNMQLVYTILIAVGLTMLFRNYLLRLKRTLFIFDTIGIGLYTVVGVEIGISAGLHPLMSITLGCITACFGGVIRDILINEIPIIFRKNIYATACIIGGMTYFLLRKLGVPTEFVFTLSALVVIITRICAVVFKLQLPSLYKKEK